MESLPELVGTVHIIIGPYRGNPIALYMCQDGSICQISPRIYPWNQTIGVGDTPNRAAADFEAKWKETELADDMYTGPYWEEGIKPEKPKPVTPPKSAAPLSKPEVKQEVKTPSSQPAPTPDISEPVPESEDPAP